MFESHPRWRESRDQEREVRLAPYRTPKGSLQTERKVELVDGLLTILRRASA